MSRPLQQRLMRHLPSESETRVDNQQLGGQIDPSVGHVETSVSKPVQAGA